MERLPELQDAVGPALQMLGDGNWKMGEGVQVGKGPKSTDLDERTIMEHFLCRSIPEPTINLSINMLFCR